MNFYLLDTIAFLSLLISAFSTRAMIWINIADIPVERSSHIHSTPRAGGVAIVIGFSCFIIAVDQFFLHILTPQILIIVISSVGVSVLGLTDDIKPLPYKIRLALQFLLASAAVQLQNLLIPDLPSLSLGKIAPFLAILWVVGFTNAVNFMDGLNGLVGGCTLISIAFLLYIIPMTEPLFYLFLGLFISTTGFLRYNFHCGRIFLGDVGSQFLGFLIAATALGTINYPKENADFFIIPLLFLPLLYDAAFTIVRRTLKRDNIFSAHREHLYQLLNRSGWSHDKVSLLYFGYTVLSGLGALYLSNHPHNVRISWCIPYVVLYTLHTLFVLKRAQLKGVKL